MDDLQHWTIRQRRLRLLILAPYLDDRDVGEAYVAFKWVKALAAHADITLLAMTRPEWSDRQSILPEVRGHYMPEPAWARRAGRLNAMGKLSYGSFSRWARARISKLLASGERFDIAHQLSPFAVRHSSPLRHFSIPYVLGPKAGSLPTPAPLKSECGADPLYMHLRALDGLRARLSPSLRASYARAALVLGAAPYVENALPGLSVRRFAVESELGVDRLPKLDPYVPRQDRSQPIRLLHVGRGVRSKGLRDAVTALSRLPAGMHVHLDVAGKGPEMAKCEALAHKLGVAQQITFHGQIRRDAVDRLYGRADIFLFPSFREPSGSVIYEAMSFGLPIIGARSGGPGYVITPQTGCLVEPDAPDRFADRIKDALVVLIQNPVQRWAMGRAARRFIEQEGLWAAKARRMLARYAEITSPFPSKHSEETLDVTE